VAAHVRDDVYQAVRYAAARVQMRGVCGARSLPCSCAAVALVGSYLEVSLPWKPGSLSLCKSDVTDE
jgi:hypothetical protein